MASASALPARNKKEYFIRVTTSDSCQDDLSKKIVKYFQSSKSGGGECNVTKENGFYIVSFKYGIDWEQLKKRDHRLDYKNLHLTVTKYNPIPGENRNQEVQLESESKITSEEESYQVAKDKCRNEEIIGSTNTEKTQSMNYSIKNTEITGQPQICRDFTNNLQFGIKNKVTPASEEKRDETTKDDKNSGDIVKTDIGRTKANEYSMRIAESENLINKIFLKVSATLNLDLLSKAQREVIKETFPQLQVNSDTSNVIQEVTGTFNDIEKIYKYIEKPFVQHKEFSYDEKNPPQQEQNTLCVPSALYEYFNDVYPEIIKRLNNQFNVKMNVFKNSQDANTSIHFFSLSDNANIAKAQQLFTDTIQSITADWKQEKVILPEKRHPSSEKLKQIVREHFAKIHVIVEGNKVILRGPSSQLTGAKKFLEEGEAFQQALKITSFGMKTEVTVNVEHLRILGKFKSIKMKEIEEKYTVKMEQKPADSKSVKVSFRTLNDSFNLEVHACQAFLILLQDTITNIIRKRIPLDPKKSIPLFEEDLKLEGIEIILQYNEGSVFLMGSPADVWAAEMKLKILKGALQTAGAVGDEEPMDTIDSSFSNKNSQSKEDNCTICMDRMKNKKILDKCKHAFCTECINKAMSYKPVCPVCNVMYGVITGNQPDGTMDFIVIKDRLPGYRCDTIKITYTIKSGTNGDNHPNKGQQYNGTGRVAFLPNDTEGREILKLLKKAFDQKLIFTVGESRTTGAKNVVTWNDIHHKTSMTGGTANFGYPDPDYLRRVRDELKAKGIE